MEASIFYPKTLYLKKTHTNRVRNYNRDKGIDDSML